MSTPANPIGQAKFTVSPDFTQIPLLSDGHHVVSRPALAVTGLGIVYRGTILKIDPLTGHITKPVAAVDCNCVLVNDIDATAADAAAIVYTSGKVKADALTWPALPVGAVTDALRDYGILVESVMQVNGTMAENAPMPFAAAPPPKEGHTPEDGFRDVPRDWAAGRDPRLDPGLDVGRDPRLDPAHPQYDPKYDPRLDPSSRFYDSRYDPKHAHHDPALPPLEPISAIRARASQLPADPARASQHPAHEHGKVGHLKDDHGKAIEHEHEHGKAEHKDKK